MGNIRLVPALQSANLDLPTRITGLEVRDPQSLGYCHCTRCQRWTGSSLAGVVVARENFTFTRGEELVHTVAAGLMRELDLEPGFHLQVAYKPTWHEIGGDAPQFAENPPA